MTATVSSASEAGHAATAERPAPLYAPRVAPLEKPLGGAAFFVALLKNPLRVLPAAAYEEAFVISARAGRAVCWITEPSLIKTVLLERRDAFPRTHVTLRLLGPLLGNGVLTADGRDWKWQRQTAAPVFRHGDLLAFVPTIVDAAERLLADWRTSGREAVRTIERDMTLVTFDVISHTLLPGGDAHVAPLVARSGFDYQRPLGWQMAYANFGLPKWFPHPGMLGMRIAQRQLRSAVAKLVAERRATPTGADDLLQRLMAAKNPETGARMADALLIDNLLTFLMAGHETTAKALTWTLYLIARAPHWQERILAEVQAVAGAGTITAHELDRLLVTRAVLKEAMRLYPPAPMMTRVVAEDIELGGHSLKAGTLILIPIFAVHRHRALWEDPNRFDPERFRPECEAAHARTQFMPFGFGPRTCIGNSFAMMEAMALLASFVRAARFEWDGVHLPEPVSRVTLRPKGGMPLKVWLREEIAPARAPR